MNWGKQSGNLKRICLMTFLLSVISCSHEANRIKNVSNEIQVHTSNLQGQGNYEISVGQQLLLDYEIDTNAYAIQLDEIAGKDSYIPIETVQRKETDSGDQKVNFNLPNGCTPYRRDFFINQENQFQGRGEDYITDLIVLPKKKLIFVLTENFEVIMGEFDIVYPSETNDQYSISTKFDFALSYKSKLQQIYQSQHLDTTNSFGFATENENWGFIITKYGSVKFDINTFGQSDVIEEVFIENSFQTRIHIQDIVSHRDYVYVVVGSEGVDIYKVKDNVLEQVFELENELQQNAIELGNQSISAERVVINNGMLVVLDTINGIYFYDVTDPAHTKKGDFSLHLSNVVSFDLRGNTMIVVFGGFGQDKVWEIFLDYQKKNYYVNRVYIDDITYTDVRMDRYFAILMSDSAHRIISHSVYKGFTNTSLWEKHRYFRQFSLKFLVLLNYSEDDKTFFVQKRSYDVENQLSIQKVSFLIAAGGERFSIHQVRELNTQIRCVSDTPIVKDYRVTINSTSCDTIGTTTSSLGNLVHSGQNLEYRQNEINPYLQCQRVFNIQFAAKGQIVDTTNIAFISALIVGVLFFVLFVGCFLFFNYRQAKREKQQAKQRWEDITYKHSRSNIVQDIQKNVQQSNQQGGDVQEQQPQNQPEKQSKHQIQDEEDGNEEVKYGLE